MTWLCREREDSESQVIIVDTVDTDMCDILGARLCWATDEQVTSLGVK